MLVTEFLDRILVLSGGGLVSAVVLSNGEARILINWPEEYSVKAMKLVACILSEQGRRDMSIFSRGSWLAYVPNHDDGGFIILTRVKDERYKLLALGLTARLAEFLKGLPEESSAIGEKVVEFLQKQAGAAFKTVKKLTVRPKKG